MIEKMDSSTRAYSLLSVESLNSFEPEQDQAVNKKAEIEMGNIHRPEQEQKANEEQKIDLESIYHAEPKLECKVQLIRECLKVTKVSTENLGFDFEDGKPITLTDDALLKLMRGVNKETSQKMDALSDKDIAFILNQIKAYQVESQTSEFIKTTKNIALYYVCMINGHEGARHEELIQKEMKFLLDKFLQVAKGQKTIEAVFRFYLLDVLCRKVQRWLKGNDMSKEFAVFAAKTLLGGGITAFLFSTLARFPGIPIWVHFIILAVGVGSILVLAAHAGLSIIRIK